MLHPIDMTLCHIDSRSLDLSPKINSLLFAFIFAVSLITQFTADR